MKRGEPPERRTPLQRSPLKRRGKRPRQMSARRRAEKDERVEVREYVLARDRYCQAEGKVPGVPCGGLLECDEIISRARGGDYLDPDACQALCHVHNRWKEDHPADAIRFGLARHSWDA